MRYQPTQRDIDDLVRSMLNYYLLVKTGAIRDDSVGPEFLSAVKEIAKKGVSILKDPDN